jgi:hypothetical protein
MQWDLLHVHNREPVSLEQRPERSQGVVAEVFVIDGVELEPLDHRLDVWSLDHRHAVIF